MKELAELRKIVENQKTVRTKRLGPLLDEIQKSYIQTANKVKHQKETIKKINSNYSVANSKEERIIRDYMDEFGPQKGLYEDLANKLGRTKNQVSCKLYQMRKKGM